MRSKEFIRDSVLDNMVAQVKQPKTPPPGTANTELAANASDAEIRAWMAANPGKAAPGTTHTTAVPGAPIDDIIDQAGADTQDAKLSTAGLKAATGFMQGLKQGSKMPTVAGGIHQSSYGKTPQQQQQIAYQAGQTNPQIGQYLKSAAGNQPLKQATGNPGVDAVLKNVGLLK